MTQDGINLLIGLLVELRGRYDGAPDSPTRWMGFYIEELENYVESLEGGAA